MISLSQKPFEYRILIRLMSKYLDHTLERGDSKSGKTKWKSGLKARFSAFWESGCDLPLNDVAYRMSQGTWAQKTAGNQD